ncbi:peptidyl-prolyl cis-trans isomerase-like 1 [Hippocampus comes]|uniref:Peptidyl-prolyl cis-trans isomerase n=1 Tax=Hippocampus comes TaxID=109280 RepID=A0A3Q2Y8D6_HIPCM|nr:PREDICTED: peptidyl-prolyl cis-trans isomerase-like 1 [Hippocampus comes]XP_051933297.1 peptidyl-prolyl cis-trans isomerase-like 1 [Hippocampus zosterae]
MSGIPPDTWQPPTVSLETTMGTIVLELYWRHAPKTCKNFAELARRGYYNNTKFHRIIQNFMVQGGDPTGTGRGGASIFGKQFEDELHPELKFTGAGIIAMANAGPDSNGSQFFLTLRPTQWLDGKHSIFGRVHQGMGVLNRIGLVETKGQDRPVDDVKIISASVSN